MKVRLIFILAIAGTLAVTGVAQAGGDDHKERWHRPKHSPTSPPAPAPTPTPEVPPQPEPAPVTKQEPAPTEQQVVVPAVEVKHAPVFVGK